MKDEKVPFPLTFLVASEGEHLFIFNNQFQLIFSIGFSYSLPILK